MRFREVRRSGFEKSCPVGGKLLAECLGYRSRFPASDGLAVQSRRRHDFHRRVTEKTLVCLTKGLNLESPLLDGNVLLASQGENDIARDPVKDAAGERGGTEPACGD